MRAVLPERSAAAAATNAQGTGNLELKARTEPHPQAGAVAGIPDTLDFYEVVNSRSVGEKVETQPFVVGDPQGHRFYELAMKVRRARDRWRGRHRLACSPALQPRAMGAHR